MTYARDPYDTVQPPCVCTGSSTRTTPEFCPAHGDPARPAPEPPPGPDVLAARARRVLARHVAGRGGGQGGKNKPRCTECGFPMPCPTAVILAGRADPPEPVAERARALADQADGEWSIDGYPYGWSVDDVRHQWQNRVLRLLREVANGDA